MHTRFKFIIFKLSRSQKYNRSKERQTFEEQKSAHEKLHLIFKHDVASA